MEYAFERELETKKGIHYFQIKLKRMLDVSQKFSGIALILNDITESKQLEDRLSTMSITDELTGLYNRRGFITFAQQQLKVTERAKKDMLLFFADLNKMKQINDTLGHPEGDKALVEVATILKETFRESDIIGRVGGDEFAILAIDTNDETREVLIKRLRTILDTYNRLEGRKYQISLSVGISHYDPQTPSSLNDLMDQADTLMYEEKRKKQN
jgi:diguanylate cyclase (GGDEF)-like protein